MTIKYWKIQCEQDADAYSIRGKTRKEVVAEMYSRADFPYYTSNDVITVEHRAYDYKDAFNLINQCLSEDRNGYLISSQEYTEAQFRKAFKQTEK